MSRFDCVKYDDVAAENQRAFKAMFEELEKHVVATLSGRPQALVLTKLEEAYMWVGKAIRDEQVARGGDATDQPKRGE
jgi:hypothetical protein